MCYSPGPVLGKVASYPLPQVLKNVKVQKKVPLESLPKVKESIAACESKLGSKGRVLFRYSGTENLARIMLEGEDSHELEGMASDIAESLLNSTV